MVLAIYQVHHCTLALLTLGSRTAMRGGELNDMAWGSKMPGNQVVNGLLAKLMILDPSHLPPTEPLLPTSPHPQPCQWLLLDNFAVHTCSLLSTSLHPLFSDYF